jgi:hypothetical protein
VLKVNIAANSAPVFGAGTRRLAEGALVNATVNLAPGAVLAKFLQASANSDNDLVVRQLPWASRLMICGDGVCSPGEAVVAGGEITAQTCLADCALRVGTCPTPASSGAGDHTQACVDSILTAS